MNVTRCVHFTRLKGHQTHRFAHNMKTSGASGRSRDRLRKYVSTARAAKESLRRAHHASYDTGRTTQRRLRGYSVNKIDVEGGSSHTLFETHAHPDGSADRRCLLRRDWDLVRDSVEISTAGMLTSLSVRIQLRRSLSTGTVLSWLGEVVKIWEDQDSPDVRVHVMHT